MNERIRELIAQATHEKHICPHYRQILEILDLKRTGEEVKLTRYEVLGE